MPYDLTGIKNNVIQLRVEYTFMCRSLSLRQIRHLDTRCPSLVFRLRVPTIKRGEVEWKLHIVNATQIENKNVFFTCPRWVISSLLATNVLGLIIELLAGSSKKFYSQPKEERLNMLQTKPKFDIAVKERVN